MPLLQEDAGRCRPRDACLMSSPLHIADQVLVDLLAVTASMWLLKCGGGRLVHAFDHERESVAVVAAGREPDLQAEVIEHGCSRQPGAVGAGAKRGAEVELATERSVSFAVASVDQLLAHGSREQLLDPGAGHRQKVFVRRLEPPADPVGVRVVGVLDHESEHAHR